MKCPNCGKKVRKNGKCENCKIVFIKQKQNDNQPIFLFIIVLSIILIALVAILLVRDDVKYNKKYSTTKITTKSSNNKGIKTDLFNHAEIGETLIASYYDGKKYYDVDVTGIKYIEGAELNKYNYTPKDGFIGYGLIYKVAFNDLKNQVNLNPVLNSMFISNDGENFVLYNEKNIQIETINYYQGPKIKNGESAEVVVLYSVPSEKKDYSICLGYIDKSLACIKK